MTNPKNSLSSFVQSSFKGSSRFKRRLAQNDALLQNSLLGFITGIAAALVIIGFRILFELPLRSFLPGGTPESFESLAPIWFFTLPVLGGLVVGLWLMLFSPEHRKTGVSHVITRMAYHHGKMPFRNSVAQFFGGALAILTGQSGGREGPAVHLGAAAGSQIGKHFHLPNNSLRLLVGCGTAGAIAASFNTPMAGVIFAMEVVMLEYTIIGFTPIIIASVTATLLHNVLYGAEMAFMAPGISITSLNEIPLILVYGVILGALAALFTKTITAMHRFQNQPILLRMLSAGLCTGVIAYFIPQVMGMGTDSILMAIQGEYALGLLVALALAKLFATAISVGLGMPIGVIGPTLLIGACAGAALGHISTWALEESSSNAGFYALLGMGAMMSAVLQAPLAAMIALMELTHNPNIILPGMAIVVVANITCSHIFKQNSVFIELLKKQGLNYKANPLDQVLSNLGVTALMDEHIVELHDTDLQGLDSLLGKGSSWVIVTDKDKPPIRQLFHIDQFSKAITAAPVSIQDFANSAAIKSALCSSQASLKEALNLAKESDCDHLLITDTNGKVIGALATKDILEFTQKD